MAGLIQLIEVGAAIMAGLTLMAALMLFWGWVTVAGQKRRPRRR